MLSVIEGVRGSEVEDAAKSAAATMAWTILVQSGHFALSFLSATHPHVQYTMQTMQPAMFNWASLSFLRTFHHTCTELKIIELPFVCAIL